MGAGLVDGDGLAGVLNLDGLDTGPWLAGRVKQARHGHLAIGRDRRLRWQGRAFPLVAL